MKNNGAVMLLLAPVILLWAVFTAWPVVELVRLSLYRTDFLSSRFVGLGNYAALAGSEDFLLAAVNSVVYIVLLVIGQVGLALLVCLAAFGLGKRWQDFTRIAFYLPVLSAGAIVSLFWKWIFARSGAFASAWTGIPTVSLVLSLSCAGSYVVILGAAMLGVEKSIIEAARIDGATEGQVKRLVLVPAIGRQLGLCCLLSAIAAPQIYETIAVLAPYRHTASMTFAIYSEAFRFSRHGSAAAMAVVLAVFTALLTKAKDLA